MPETEPVWRHKFCIKGCGGKVEYKQVKSFDETEADRAYYDKHEKGNWISTCTKCGHQTFVAGLVK